MSQGQLKNCDVKMGSRLKEVWKPLILVRFMWCFLFPGWLCGGSGMAALQKSRGLAPVQKHLHGLVCDCAHLRPDQRRHHGYLHLRHPVSTKPRPDAGEEEESAPARTEERRGGKLEGQNISLTSSQQLWKKKAKRKKKMFEMSCDMGLWFLAASFST